LYPRVALQILIALLGVLAALFPGIAGANQGLIVRDESMGTGRGEAVGADPVGTVDYLITPEMGITRGESLFHSFSQFGIGAGEVASFTGSAGLARIIARVTGREPSPVDGVLRSTAPGADVFLLNPNGLFFGPSGYIDVQGSFSMSTASGLEFPDGVFDTTDLASPGESPSCCGGAPTAYLFAGQTAGAAGDPAKIVVGTRFGSTGHYFGVPPDKTLSIVAGGVEVEGGQVELTGGAILLAATGHAAVRVPIDLLQESDWLESLGNDAVISISNGARLRTINPNGPKGGGRVVLRGGRLRMENSSSIVGGGPLGGGIDAQFTGDVVLTKSSGLSNFSEGPTSTGIQLNADSLALDLGSWIKSTQGEIQIWTRGATRVETGSAIKTSTQDLWFFRPPVAAGNIHLRAGSLELLSGGQILSLTGNGWSTSGDPEPAGDIDLTVAGELRIEGSQEASGEIQRSGVLSRALDEATGQAAAGDIRITANRLEMAESGLISAKSPNEAAAGGIDIRAYSSIRLTGGFQPAGHELTEISARGVGGGAGHVSLAAPVIEILDGAAVSATSLGAGNAGDVRIDANFLQVAGQSTPEAGVAQASAVYAETLAGGAAGNLELILRDGLEISDAGKLSVKTRGTGSAGSIRIEVSEGSVEISNNGLVLSESLSSAEGAGTAGSILVSASGDIRIDTDSALEATGAVVDAGDIELEAGGTLSLIESQVNTKSKSALGGNIKLNAGSMIQLVRSQVETDVGGLGNGGNIWLGQGSPTVPTPPVWTTLNASRVTATAEEGKGGFISISADQYLKSADSVVSAASDLGEDGTVEVTAPEVEVSGSLEGLPIAYLDVSALLREHCAARIESDNSSLTLEDRPNIAPEPGGYLPASVLPGASPASGNGIPRLARESDRLGLAAELASFDAGCGRRWLFPHR
jgi:filamentous hemagglutinin family protein